MPGTWRNAMYESHAGAVPAPKSGSWDPAVLDSLADINERVLEVLAGEGATTYPYASTLSSQLAAEWRALDSAGRARLAASPYLLLDCRFASEALWRAPVHVGVRDAAAVGHSFAGALGGRTLRHAMQLAWHWSRANPITAQIALGLSESGTR